MPNIDLLQPLTMVVDNGVKSFTYAVTRIDYEDSEITGIDEAGKEYTFGFGFIAAMGEVRPTETKANDPPKKDEPINLDDVPF